jgi:hypothetical protein
MSNATSKTGTQLENNISDREDDTLTMKDI